MSYSQNDEEAIICHYFTNVNKGVLLDIGANDGRTFSNSLALFEKEWTGILIEPSPRAFDKLCLEHKGRHGLDVLNVAIGTKNGSQDFWDMDEHVGNGDSSLLSTLSPEEMERWKGTQFRKTKVEVITIESLFRDLTEYRLNEIDFITLDAEGYDLMILNQIDLANVKCLCVEWNGNPKTEADIRRIVPSEMKEIYRSLENIIYGR